MCKKGDLSHAGQKGSDVSAREATKKLVAAAKQMHALQAVLGDVHDASSTESVGTAPKETVSSLIENASSAAAQAGPWAARNTIVRDVLNELTNAANRSRTRFYNSSHQTSLGHTTPGILQAASDNSPVKHKQ